MRTIKECLSGHFTPSVASVDMKFTASCTSTWTWTERGWNKQHGEIFIIFSLSRRVIYHMIIIGDKRIIYTFFVVKQNQLSLRLIVNLPRFSFTRPLITDLPITSLTNSGGALGVRFFSFSGIKTGFSWRKSIRIKQKSCRTLGEQHYLIIAYSIMTWLFLNLDRCIMLCPVINC